MWFLPGLWVSSLRSPACWSNWSVVWFVSRFCQLLSNFGKKTPLGAEIILALNQAEDCGDEWSYPWLMASSRKKEAGTRSMMKQSSYDAVWKHNSRLSIPTNWIFNVFNIYCTSHQYLLHLQLLTVQCKESTSLPFICLPNPNPPSLFNL